MRDCEPFVDIHCHLLPGVDDGATTWAETLAMARMAVAEGFSTIVATPHQFAGAWHVPAETIRRRAAETTAFLADQHVPLTVLAGGEIRVGPAIVDRIVGGETLTLAELGRHALIELPFEAVVPTDDLLVTLRTRDIVPIMAHPERNRALRAQPQLVAEYVRQGWLMQLTAGSLTGAFGADVQLFAEQILSDGLTHFISTDAHSTRNRPPLMRDAFARACELVGRDTAVQLCSTNPLRVSRGEEVTSSIRRPNRGWFSWARRAA